MISVRISYLMFKLRIGIKLVLLRIKRLHESFLIHLCQARQVDAKQIRFNLSIV